MKPFLISLMVALYLAGYATLRIANAETWEHDGRTYVIFPESPIALYYIYRPVAVLDGALTGMRFHIGPHRRPNHPATGSPDQAVDQ